MRSCYLRKLRHCIKRPLRRRQKDPIKKVSPCYCWAEYTHPSYADLLFLFYFCDVTVKNIYGDTWEEWNSNGKYRQSTGFYFSMTLPLSKFLITKNSNKISSWFNVSLLILNYTYLKQSPIHVNIISFNRTQFECMQEYQFHVYKKKKT